MSAAARTTPVAPCADAATPAAALTVFTNGRGPLTKRFERGADGAMAVTAAAQLVDGRAETVRVAGLAELRDVLDRLRPEQAVSYGVCGRDAARVTTQARLPDAPGAIARDRAHFAWPAGGGVWMLDYDPAPDAPALTRDELVAELREALPTLAGVALLWGCSASSCIHDAATGTELRGVAGQRLYVLVDDAAAIPRLGDVLVARLWLAGHGRIAVSSAGALLRRTLVDASVWQPERLDFAAGASCGPGLVQRQPERTIVPARPGGGDSAWLRATDVPELGAAEAARFEALVGEESAAAQPQAERIKGERRGRLVGELEQRGVPHDEAERTAREAVDGGVLGGAFVLHPEDGGPVTVRELLADPARWDGARFADPLEPDYRGDARIAVAQLQTARPGLFSHAHGGRRFALVREAAVVEVCPGAEAAVADACLAALAATFEVFDSPDGGLVLTADAQGHTRRLDGHGLRDLLSRHIAFRRSRRRYGGGVDRVPADVPRGLPDIILARSGRRGLPVLRGVVTAPTLRADGSLLDRPGYDRASGLLGVFDGGVPGREWRVPTPDAAVAAFARLWAPVAAFPYVSGTDRAVALAALLTACVRPTLGVAPGFAFDAPAAGTGKTLLAKCVAALAGADDGGLVAFSDAEELQKALAALLIEGARFILVDNVSCTLDVDMLNALLTAETWSPRLLGASKTVTVPNNALLTLSGNNLRLGGDLNRRVLRCRLDAQSETPWSRSFDVDPLAVLRAERRALVEAALTILRAYRQAGCPRVAVGGVASFERWDARVRQAVCWLARLPGLGVALGDPADAIAAGFEVDPIAARLGAVLVAWHGVFGGQVVPVRDAVRAAEAQRRTGGDGPEVALLDALDEVAGERGVLNPRRLGQFLAAHEGRRVDGLHFVRGGTRQRAATWGVAQGGA